MPSPHTIPFKEANGNGHYESKELPQDRVDFLEALGLPEYAGDVVSASPSSVSGQVTTYWETSGHVIKADNHTGLAKLTAGVLDSVAAPQGAVVGTTDVQTLSNKTIDNPIVIGSVSGLDKYDVGLGNVDNTSDANKPLSNAETAALADKEDKPNKGIASGYAGLDTLGKVPLAQLPDAIIGASRYQGTWNAAINNPTIPPAAPANNGYYYSVSTSGSTNIDGISTWAIGDTIISNGSIWQKIPVANAVQSVNGKQGIVVVNKADVGLGNVDNTSDATKNSAAATLTNKIIGGASNTLTVRLNTADVVGDLPVTRLDGGTAASSTTFWRGDGHWVSPVGAGDVQGPGSSVDGDVAIFNGSTGKQLRVGQILSQNVAPGMISGQAEKAVVVDPEDMFLEVDKVTGLLRCIRAKYFSRLPRGFISGMELKNNVADGTNDIDVDVGECRDDTHSADMRLNSVLTKQLDVAWAAGNIAGGRDTGAIANGTWHVYVIMNPTTGVVDALFSVNATAPTLPSGFTLKRRIGAVIRVSGAIRAFRQQGDFFGWSAPALDANGGAVAVGVAFNQPMANSIPSGIKVECGFNTRVHNATTVVAIEMSDPDSTGGGGAGTLYNPGANINAACFVVLMTNAASSVRVHHIGGTGTASYWIAVQWYRDLRGK